MSCPRFLFILKYRNNYGEFTDSYSGHHKSSGLSNSARFVCDMLIDSGISAKIVQVVDNNGIDREVTKHKPTHVVIEALWVVPEKFHVLRKLHPGVKWIVRGHSEIPFLSNEGIAIKWIKEYIKHPNVVFASNSVESVVDLKIAVGCASHKIVYLPNFYPVPRTVRSLRRKSDALNIACLGAIRPLKNQLIQAIAALEFADQKGQTLNFHVNDTRKEQGGANNLKNIEALFEGTKHHLVKHDWLPHDKLLSLLATMDLSMNVSLSESFNIVCADSVSQGVPVVCSSEVAWTSCFSQARPTSSADIVRKMCLVTNPRSSAIIAQRNLSKLKRFSRKSRQIWLNWLHNN